MDQITLAIRSVVFEGNSINATVRITQCVPDGNYLSSLTYHAPVVSMKIQQNILQGERV